MKIEGVVFERAGRIERRSQHLQFKLEPAYLRGGDKYDETGWVYLWVKEVAKESGRVICYVGATTKRIVDRCGGQKGGFTSSMTGKSHARKISAHLRSDPENEMAVYVKRAKRCKVLEVKNVSLVMAEEAAMLMKFKDSKVKLWNFEPQGRAKKK